MVMKQPFTTQSPRAFVFDYEDFESGVGYVEYQGSSTETSTTLDYHLDKNTFHSSSVETQDDAPGVVQNVATKVFDLDFDTNEFNISRTMKGTAMISTTAGFKFNSADTVAIYTIAKLRTYDGSTETEIGSAQSASYSVASNDAWKTSNFTVPITVPETVIPIGTQLRVTVEVWILSASASAASIDAIVGHSPYNLTGNIEPATQDSTYNQTIAYIPYNLE